MQAGYETGELPGCEKRQGKHCFLEQPQTVQDRESQSDDVSSTDLEVVAQLKRLEELYRRWHKSYEA